MAAKSAWIRLPRHVIIGADALERAPAAIAELPLSGQPMIITSPTPRRLVGDDLANELAAMSDAEPHVIEIQRATAATIQEVIDTATDAGYLIGVGGGNPIDVAKLASDRLDVGFVSVPTAASHDGIVSGRASIPDGDTRHSVAADPPHAVIADTGIIAEAPWELMTAGCADIISNYTAVRDWRLAQRLRDVEYSEYAAALSEMTAEMLVENADAIRPELEDAAWVVLKALVSSGVAMSIANSSRPASGAEHLISHQLDRIAPGRALHGHQVGVASIFTAYLQTGEEGDWTRIRDALTQIDAPTTAAGLGISTDEFVEAAVTAHEIRDRYTILGDGITMDAVKRAGSVTGVL